jgi:hypothetical protein
MEELRPSSGPILGDITYGGRDPAVLGFLFPTSKMYARAWTRSSPVGAAETPAIRMAKLVFMANYPLQRHEDL